nr:hypothetical protein NG677_17555 [Methylobacterium sp. OTU13CASTA1]
MPRWFRLLAALLVYALAMAVITRTIGAWALPAENRTFESIARLLLTLGAFGVVTAFIVYRLFVRSGSSSGDLR